MVVRVGIVPQVVVEVMFIAVVIRFSHQMWLRLQVTLPV